MPDKRWTLIKNRDGEIGTLSLSPAAGKTVADLTTKDAYKLWLRADKVWVDSTCTELRFVQDGRYRFRKVRKHVSS